MTSATDQVYLDHAATTPVAPSVRARMLACLDEAGNWANPASRHAAGQAASAQVETARRQVADLVGASADAVIWTSGATESINLAVLGVMRFAMQRGRGHHLITTAIEHSATLAACRQLVREGAELTVLAVDNGGRLDADAVIDALRPETVMVSLMLVNNETGVCLPVADIAERLRSTAVVLHVDAAQAAAFESIDVRCGIDLLSLSAHKFYGPKGVGALVIRRQPRLRLQPLCFGGGQEQGERPGTLPVHQLVGMGEAARMARRRRARDRARLSALRTRFVDALQRIGAVHVNGVEPVAPHLVNLSVIGVHGEALADRLAWLAYSAGSACHAADGSPSPVLRAMGLPDGLALASLRLSLGRGSRWRVLQTVVERLATAIDAERRRCVLWAAYCDGVALDALYQWRAADLQRWWSSGGRAPGEQPRSVVGWLQGAAGSVEQGTLIGCRVGLDEQGAIAALDWQCYCRTETHETCSWLATRLIGQRPGDVELGAARDWCTLRGMRAERLDALLVLEDAVLAALAQAAEPVR